MVVKENEYYDVSDTETGAATKETIGCQPKSSTNMSYNPATGGWSGLAGWAEIGIENV